MAIFTQSLSLDVSGRNKYKYIYAKQGDAGSRFVNVTMLANGVQITPESGATAKIRALKPDGTGVYNPATINKDGTVTAELTSQMLAVKGDVKTDIMLVGKNNEILSTVTFYVQVEEAPTGTVVASSNEFLELVEMRETVKANATSATEAKAAAVAAKEAAEKAATEADNLLSGKENISNKVNDIDTDCTDEQYPSAKAVKDYLYFNYYDSDEADSMYQHILVAGDNVTITKPSAAAATIEETISVNLNSKYDASNVEVGSGELTVYSEDMPVPSATFAYQRTGDFVTVALSIEFSQAEMGKTKSYQLLGLPYKNEMVTRQATITNNKNKLTVSVGQGTSTLTVLTQGEAVNLQQKEFITDTITYKIRK